MHFPVTIITFLQRRLCQNRKRPVFRSIPCSTPKNQAPWVCPLVFSLLVSLTIFGSGESLPALLRQRGEVEEESAQALFVKTKAAQEKELGIEWEITSWKQYAYKVTRVGRALIAMGILPGTKAIMLGQTKVVRKVFFFLLIWYLTR